MSLPVTQADRDAAAELWQSLRLTVKGLEWQIDWMRDGTADYGPVVQAFARHRINHTPTPSGEDDAGISATPAA